jgi:uncharacterized protein GlcG (DUF336 family)
MVGSDAMNTPPAHALARRGIVQNERGYLLYGDYRQLPMNKAQLIIEAAIAKAKEVGQPVNIAAIDAGTNMTACTRMDGAWLGGIGIGIGIAINKAFTAKAFDISTLELGKNSQPGDQFFGIHVSNHTRVMIFAGGIPIKDNGQVVGAVGVSGGSGAQDQTVAEAAVAAFR